MTSDMTTSTVLWRNGMERNSPGFEIGFSVDFCWRSGVLLEPYVHCTVLAE